MITDIAAINTTMNPDGKPDISFVLQMISSIADITNSVKKAADGTKTIASLSSDSIFKRINIKIKTAAETAAPMFPNRTISEASSLKIAV